MDLTIGGRIDGRGIVAYSRAPAMVAVLMPMVAWTLGSTLVTSLARLGDTHADAGDTASARRCWRQELTLMEALHHSDAEDLRRKLRPAAVVGIDNVMSPR